MTTITTPGTSLLTGETTGYYTRLSRSRPYIARVLAQGFAYQGEPSPTSRRRIARRARARRCRLTAFVNFLQNHDQIGNRALGERLTELATPDAIDAALAITLLAPGPPLMFMGDEWGAREPFPFFCDFKGDLAQAVRDGPAARIRRGLCQIPRRGARSACRRHRAPRAKLDWERKVEARARRAPYARARPARRAKAHIMPRLPHLADGHGNRAISMTASSSARWRFPPRRDALDAREPRSDSAASGRTAHVGACRSGAACRPIELPPWSVFVPRSGRADAASPFRIATYRLQLNKDFGFDAGGGAGALSQGARHQPSLRLAVPQGPRRQHSTATTSSTTTLLNPEFGGDEAFARLSDALKQHDLGLILDFVPNHMAVGGHDNPWWLDVLEWGQVIAARRLLRHRLGPAALSQNGGVLLPVLGQPYNTAADRRRDRAEIRRRGGSFSAWYFQHRFPINPHRYSDILTTIVSAADAANEPAGQAMLALADEHRNPGTPSYRNAPALKRRLAEILDAPSVIERGLKAYRADHEAGINLLHRLLERQHYRLAFWRLAPSSINYRRFFDVNELAGLRMEDAGTFRQTHVAGRAADRRRPACTGCGSTTSTAPLRSAAIHPPPADADRAGARPRPRAVPCDDREDRRGRRGAAAVLRHRRHHRL